jgi:hypothetical protein
METLSSLIPTDNLYRFLSIAGILIFSFCFFYPDYRIYQISQKIINAEFEDKILDVKRDRYKEKSTEYTAEIKEIQKANSEDFKFIDRVSKLSSRELSSKQRQKYAYLLANSKKNLSKNFLQLDRIVELLDSQAITADSLIINGLRQRMILRFLKSDLERLGTLNLIAAVGQVIGLLMTIVGFCCWFYFIQRPQDILLSYQIDELNKSKK